VSDYRERFAARIKRLDWRCRGKVPTKKGPTASKYAIRALERVNRRLPGGQRWLRIQKAGQ
jgi:hypothetical protein